jgi:hypothetical protein
MSIQKLNDNDKLSKALDQWEIEAAPDDLVDKVMARLDQTAQESSQGPEDNVIRFPGSSRQRFAWSMALAASICFALYFLPGTVPGPADLKKAPGTTQLAAKNDLYEQEIEEFFEEVVEPYQAEVEAAQDLDQLFDVAELSVSDENKVEDFIEELMDQNGAIQDPWEFIMNEAANKEL